MIILFFVIGDSFSSNDIIRMVLEQLSPRKIAPQIIAPRIIAPWMIAPWIIGFQTIALEDNFPPDNCPLTTKFPPLIITPTQTNSPQRLLRVN